MLLKNSKYLGYKIILIIGLIAPITHTSCMHTNNLQESTSQENNQDPQEAKRDNAQKVLNKLNLGDYGTEFFKQSFAHKIINLKIVNNLLIILFYNNSRKIINLETKTELFKNTMSLKISKSGEYAFVIFSRLLSKIIKLNNMEVIFEFTDLNQPNIIFSKNNKYALAIDGSYTADLILIPKKKIALRFHGVIDGKFTKNSEFLSLTLIIKTSIIDLKNMRFFGQFLGIATISNTGKFLYGKVKTKSDLISRIFNKTNRISINKSINQIDFKNQPAPALASLKNKTVLKKFNIWSLPEFSKQDKFVFLQDLTSSSLQKNNAHLIDTNTNEIIREFTGLCSAKFNKNDSLVIVKTENNSNPKESISELISLKETIGKTIKSLKNTLLLESKFCDSCNLLKLKYEDNFGEIFDLEENTSIAKFNENENYGLNSNCFWQQDDNNDLEIIKLSNKIKLFKKNLCNKYKQTSNNLENTAKKNFCDVRIITLT